MFVVSHGVTVNQGKWLRSQQTCKLCILTVLALLRSPSHCRVQMIQILEYRQDDEVILSNHELLLYWLIMAQVNKPIRRCSSPTDCDICRKQPKLSRHVTTTVSTKHISSH
jgi:hypothetical protein